MESLRLVIASAAIQADFSNVFQALFSDVSTHEIPECKADSTAVRDAENTAG